MLPERYEPIRHIADGGMATVWEVRDTVLDRLVAVKLLSPALAADDDARARFTREGRAAARLSAHPHVVTVYDAGEHEGRAYLVMALYRGGSVADRLREGVPPRDLALRWLEQAADGLDAAHAEGVVHRDVKPANLLLDERDRVAVGDFGIATARWAASVTQVGLVVGTAAYLSPEQRQGRAATAASDRFALGVVAHQLLTGRRPDDDVPAGAAALPAAADAAIARATALDPGDRHGSCRAFVADLERALAVGDDATTVADADAGTTAVLGAGAGALAGAGLGAAAAAAAAGHDAVATPRTPRPPRTSPPSPSPVAAHPGPGAGGTAGPPPPGRRSRGALALALLAAFVLAAGATAAVLGGGDDPSGGGERAGTTGSADTSTGSTTGEPGTEGAEPTPTPAPAPEPPADEPTEPVAEDPSALNDQGYALFLDGRYDEAIPLLERAVAGLEATPEDQVYAFALYNLGASLRRAGRPAEAIPYLERRLEVSDFKVDVVRDELDAAYADAGIERGDGDDDGASVDGATADAKPGKGPKVKGRDKGG